MTLSTADLWFDRPVLSGAEGLTTNGKVVGLIGRGSAH